jgi:hypothetical protein
MQQTIPTVSGDSAEERHRIILLGLFPVAERAYQQAFFA